MYLLFQQDGNPCNGLSAIMVKVKLVGQNGPFAEWAGGQDGPDGQDGQFGPVGQDGQIGQNRPIGQDGQVGQNGQVDQNCYPKT